MIPEKLASARYRLSRVRPYVSAALWALVPVPKPGLGTLAVDRWWRLYYDPAAIEGWSLSELAGVLYHEVWHLLRDHPGRCELLGADPLGWNISADAEINDDRDIYTDGLTLPEGAITPQKMGWPDGLLAEEYYRLLEKERAQGGGEDGPQSVAFPPGKHREEGQAQGAGDGSQEGQDKHPFPAQGKCGSAAHGRREEWEEPAPGEGGPAGVDPTRAEAIRRKVAKDLVEHARSRGTVPAGELRWAEEKLGPPKVNWRQALGRLIREAVGQASGAVDYTRTRPNRRQAAYGPVIMPALYRPVPEVAVVVDTSGSIREEELTQALAEMKGILEAVGQRGVTVLSVDAEVHKVQRVFRPEQVQLLGGGGTDMGRGIEAALELRPRPKVVIVLTDGETPWPETPPPARVIVGLLANPSEPTPEWAQVVRIEGGRDE